MDNTPPQYDSPRWVAVLFSGGCLALGFLGSGLGGAFGPQPWYDDTAKPRFWPPQWFFPMIWVSNYILMGIATWQVWRERKREPIALPLALFAAHLAHNVAFIPVVNRTRSRAVYVGMDMTALALATATTLAFRQTSPRAACTMLPYLVWLAATTWLKVRWWRME